MFVWWRIFIGKLVVEVRDLDCLMLDFQLVDFQLDRKNPPSVPCRLFDGV